VNDLRDIPGYEGLYAVTKDGRVWAHANWLHQGMFLKQVLRGGYRAVHLCNQGKARMKPVHRLVAITFIPNPNSLSQINHKDGVKTNNKVQNLEWCTASHNRKHSWDIGTTVITAAFIECARRKARAMGTQRRRLSMRQALVIRELSKTVPRRELMKIYGLSAPSLSELITGKTYKE